MRKSERECLSTEYDISMYKSKPVFDFFKRAMDILVSVIFFLLFFWVYLILMILVRCTSKGPIFYGHERVGKDGKVFKVWKFRSMYLDDRPLEEIFTPEQLKEYYTNYKVTDDPRCTKLGKFLRATSLDELPQLWNIFVGEMSIVGWRPILPQELELYGKNKELLTKIKPGLTGYWACHGRSEISYDHRIKMELYYVWKRSLGMDIRIVFHTFFGVLFEKGAE